MKLGRHGELVPGRGFSRDHTHAIRQGSAWTSHDGLLVLSTLEQAHLPGSGDPPLVGPQWLVSVSRRGAERCTPDEARHVVDCFAMPAYDEDNHHPGVARHLWCPVDPAYRHACECKIDEVLVTDGDYAWSNDPADCRGCEGARLWGRPCPIHAAAP